MTDVFYHSAETRWFLNGNGHLDQLLGWFTLKGRLNIVEETDNYQRQSAKDPFVKKEKLRTDEYLLVPGCDTTGIKQRQGRLEVKSQVAGPRPFTVGDVTGRIDQWVKWSMKPSGNIALPLEADLHQSGPWINIGKKRYTQKYSFDQGPLSAVSPDAWPDTGCNIELTLLETQEGPGSWTTIGFEAFGPPGRVMAMLDDSIRHFFAAHGPAPVRLEGRDSLSYPTWLAFSQYLITHDK
jgi:hypothetical protein